MSNYQVIIGNVGTVHEGPSLREAKLIYNTYVDRSKGNRGRCAGESVTLMAGDGIIWEYAGTLDNA